jgi:hypothetical protein
VLLLGYLPMNRMRRSTTPAYAAACGQWVVARRSAYREVQGHAASPSSLHDGISLPRVFRTAGWQPTSLTAASSQAAACMKISAPYGLASARAPAKAWRHLGALPIWTLLIVGGHVLPTVVLLGGLVSGQPQLILAGGFGVASTSCCGCCCGHASISRWPAHCFIRSARVSYWRFNGTPCCAICWAGRADGGAATTFDLMERLEGCGT